MARQARAYTHQGASNLDQLKSDWGWRKYRVSVKGCRLWILINCSLNWSHGSIDLDPLTFLLEEFFLKVKASCILKNSVTSCTYFGSWASLSTKGVDCSRHFLCPMAHSLSWLDFSATLVDSSGHAASILSEACKVVFVCSSDSGLSLKPEKAAQPAHV